MLWDIAIITTFARQHAAHVVSPLTNSIQSSTYLAQLKLKYAHDSGKYGRLLQGAERRLDRQLEDLSDMRRAIISMSASSADPAVLAQQKSILDTIAMAQDSFNHEIDRLYDL